MPRCLPEPFLRAIGLLLLVLGLSLPAYSDEEFTPVLGHRGKDVFWAPTPDDMVSLMLRTAKVTADDLVVDLGAGEGRIPIAAAREFGARAVGIEYTPELADLARRNGKRAGVEDRVKIVTGDIFVEDFSGATVVTLYLQPVLNRKVRPLLLKMKPGTRVVSHSFDMGDWPPDAHLAAGNAEGFFWVVPARVEGTWSLHLPDEAQAASLQVKQRFQKFSGTLALGERLLDVRNGSLNGDEMRFEYLQPDGTVAAVTARVAGDRLSGRLDRPQGGGAVRGQRR
jgi:SAM-dependent methyltransferase